MIFDHGGNVVSVAQKEHEQIYPKPGWVEHDPKEIWARTQEVIDEAVSEAGASADDISGLGITNQRATTARTASRSRSACRWRPTSRARRCAGSSTTSTARESEPRPGISSSATST